jgi:LysR family glycine cleavage system transcriptional activator
LTSAAVSGLGVALVPKIFVCAELAGNRLIVPTAHFIRNDDGYFISYNDDPINKEALDIFTFWLQGHCKLLAAASSTLAQTQAA